MDNKFRLPKRYEGTEYCVWIEYRQLAMEYKPECNLSSGFPDFPAFPEYLTNYITDVVDKESDHLMYQYTRGFGHPRLVKAISELYGKLLGRKIDPQSEVLATIGGYEALFCAIHGFAGPGDEVIIVEPYFDCYVPMTISTGATPVFVPLRNKGSNPNYASSKDWVLDPDELARAFNSRTKLFILNTPHNPLGKVFAYDELLSIADLCKKHDVICISDEVYEWLVYKPAKHIRMGMWERSITIGSAGKIFSATGLKIGWAYCPARLMESLLVVHQNSVRCGVTLVQVYFTAVGMWSSKEEETLTTQEADATLEGMWDRTITIGSAGKIFSATGLKVGWVYCPAELMKNLFTVHQNCVHCGITFVQEATARCLEHELSLLGTPDCYLENLSTILQPKRDYFCRVLRDAGFAPSIPEGGYFIVSKWSNLAHKVNLDSENGPNRDFKFTKWMTKNVKLHGIPVSCFYREQNTSLGEDYVRYCFFKKDETLVKAESILKNWIGM